MKENSTLTIQRWGNSLAVRIPATIARSVRFSVGQQVELSIQETSVIVKPIGQPKLTLAQKLALFDINQYGGESMAVQPVGAEYL